MDTYAFVYYKIIYTSHTPCEKYGYFFKNVDI